MTTTTSADDGVREQKRRIGRALREALAHRDMTALELARQLDRSPNTVSRWLNGRSAPSLAELQGIVRVLRVRPDLFVEPPEVPTYPIEEFVTDDVEFTQERKQEKA